ncbi:MAG: hypothetical protein JXQ23_14265 [Clostridia bacterium]|nr:hypothetical protein [Clostridia bacterium]
MRISSSMMTRQAMENIEKSYSKVANTSNQVATGKRYASASESPVDFHMVNSLKLEQGEITKYFSNIENARVSVSDTEIALKDINESFQRIKELSSNAMNASVSLSDREAICIEIEQCKQQIISNLNSQSAGRFLFGGFNSKFPPIKENAGLLEYNGTVISTMTDLEKDSFISEKVVVNVSKGIKVDLKISALEIIGTGDNNLLNNIDKIISELRNEPLSSDELKNQVDILDDHFDNVLLQLTKIGATTNRLDAIVSQLTQKQTAISEKISGIEDIDIEEAILNYKLAEQAYNSTLSISGKSIQLSLMDYLR